MTNKNTILLSTDDYPPIENFSIDQKGRLFDAIFLYAIFGAEEVEEDIKIAFLFFKQRIDKHNEKFNETCKRRSEAGKRGMESRWQSAENQEDITDTPNITNITNITNDNKNDFVIQDNKNNKHNGGDGIGLDRIGEDRIGEDRMFSNENEEKEIIPPNGVIKEKKPAARFVPPTLEELREYIAEKGYEFDPETFIAHYESNGWKVNRAPMKSWRGACTTWQKRLEEERRREKARIERYEASRASPPSPPPKEQMKSPIPEYSDEEWNALPFWEQDDAIHKHYGLD